MSDTNKNDFRCCECGVHVICCECGGHVSGCVPSPIHPYCELCVWVPGWWQSAKLRKRFAHDEQWRRELALRAAAEEWEMNGR